MWLINIYRMIRSTQATGGSSHFLDLSTGTGDYQAILLLLAIVSGFPELAAPAFEALLRAIRAPPGRRSWTSCSRPGP